MSRALSGSDKSETWGRPVSRTQYRAMMKDGRGFWERQFLRADYLPFRGPFKRLLLWLGWKAGYLTDEDR